MSRPVLTTKTRWTSPPFSILSFVPILYFSITLYSSGVRMVRATTYLLQKDDYGERVSECAEGLVKSRFANVSLCCYMWSGWGYEPGACYLLKRFVAILFLQERGRERALS